MTKGKLCWRCNLGVETLYLPFAVKRGWADKVDLTPSICAKKLFLETRTWKGSRQTVITTFCLRPPKHKGKHGLPGVRYLHPSQM